MTESLTNRGEYLSAHYLAEVLPTTLKAGVFKRWTEAEKTERATPQEAPATPRAGLRALRRPFFDAKAELADPDLADPERLRKLHGEVLRALGFDPKPGTLTVERAGRTHEVAVAHAEPGIVAIEAGWAPDADAAQDLDGAARLLEPLRFDARTEITAATKLASWLLNDSAAPRYVLILNGGVLTLADRAVWGEGRYLAVSLDTAFGRNDELELGVVAALFGAEALRPPAEGGTEPLAELVAGSRQQAAGVSGELREGLRTSVELIANEVLDRIRGAGYQPQDVAELDELARRLTREALRYLYRILFLLYAEARPELGVLPVKDPEYIEGYSLARLGDLVARKLAPSAEGGFHLYESLDLLVTRVNAGYRARGGAVVGEKASEDVGLRFEPMYSDLFLPEAIGLIGRRIVAPDADPDDPDAPRLDTRLRNATLYRVLRLLMLRKGRGKRGRAGFISYAQLGINQLGAVYEGLMSYSGFVAVEQLYEVAKNGDPKDGSWMIPASKVDEYADELFVTRENPVTGVRSRVSYPPGSFVYRLAGRDRQTSASYYTPQSLTAVTVQLALKYRLDQDGTVTQARELLDWTICEPALGSGAFLNEAINQVAAEYLRRRQGELGEQLDPERYHLELQRAKAYIALHNCYGVDLNRTAVELAEVSLWLNVMHAGLQAPWFGLHLRRGNSLIGGGRRLYTAAQLVDRAWLTAAPADRPFRDGPIDDGTIHHFLLPADGWGAVAGEKEARSLAPAEAKRLAAWRRVIKREPSAKRVRRKPSQVDRLQTLARRVELLWGLVQQRLEISEREIRRDIPVWGADLPPASRSAERAQILADLTTPGTPYWRLKTLMDVWCALWFWPLDAASLLDGSADDYAGPDYTEEPVEIQHVEAPVFAAKAETISLFEDSEPAQLPLPSAPSRKKAVAAPVRTRIPLADLDDWLTFAEALVGRTDIPEGSLYSEFATLDELGEYENDLVGLTGMDQPYRLADRFPWLQTAVQIADEQGFFHWELDFAQAFARGGFDLLVGNPPWVRPEFGESTALAEFDPWFALCDDGESGPKRRAALLQKCGSGYLSMISAVAVSGKFLSALGNYAELAGISANLYRNFMVQVWRHSSIPGIGALIHYDTHFSGALDVQFRARVYSRLRLHAHFQNRRLLFPDIDWNNQFSVNLYGSPRTARFEHLSWLFDPATASGSFEHDGEGDLPGLKKDGDWDLRPHRERIIPVDEATLKTWCRLSGEQGYPPLHGRLLYPVSSGEESAIQALIDTRPKLNEFGPRVSRGIPEAATNLESPIVKELCDPETWAGVILKGPQLSVATPFAKRPPIPKRTGRPMDLTTLAENAVPRSEFRYRDGSPAPSVVADRWLDHADLAEALKSPARMDEARTAVAEETGCALSDVPEESVRKRLEAQSVRPAVSFYRVAWREWVPAATERSLFPAVIPPGPNHVHAIRSMAMRSNRETVLAAACLAGLPLDYAVRVAGREHLNAADISALPVAPIDHPLSGALLLRALRLNCLTDAYRTLWEELFDKSFAEDEWALDWAATRDLQAVSEHWDGSSPLRSECERRAALVEIDALVAVLLGIDSDGLKAMYQSRFPQLQTYEEHMYFDANGRRVASDFDAYGFAQTKEHYQQLLAHLDDPDRNPVPNGYTAPFYKADRENEYRQAHAVFSKRLQEAKDAGWEPS